MTDEQTRGPADDERVSRLSSSSADVEKTEIKAGDDVVREYEQRYYGPREEKGKRREMPRSYSTLRVSEDERLWAAVAHGSVWVTLLTMVLSYGVLVPISIFVPLVIYFIFRKHSDYVAFHALQAFVLQLLGTVGAATLFVVGGAVWVVGLVIGLLAMIILIGFVLVPVWGIVGVALLLAIFGLPVSMLFYGTVAAVETYNGRDYRYPFIARWVDRQLAGGLLNAA